MTILIKQAGSYAFQQIEIWGPIYLFLVIGSSIFAVAEKLNLEILVLASMLALFAGAAFIGDFNAFIIKLGNEKLSSLKSKRDQR